MSKYEDEQGRPQWHLHVAVPISIIVAILFQCACFIWYGAHIDAKVNQTSAEVEQLEGWRLKQNDQLSRIDSTQATQTQKLDDLSQTVHHMDDILEQHFYRK